LKRNHAAARQQLLSWDLGLTWPFNVAKGARSSWWRRCSTSSAQKTSRDPSQALLFNFDGTLRSGFGDPSRQTQIGVHWVF